MSLKSRLDTLEKALSVQIPRIKLSWPPLDGLYETEDGQRLPWDEYCEWCVANGYPRPIRLTWPEHQNE